MSLSGGGVLQREHGNYWHGRECPLILHPGHHPGGGGQLLEAKGPMTDLVHSHCGTLLVVCDTSNVVTVFSVTDGYLENNDFYGDHTKIICLAWSLENEHFALGGMDIMVYVWNLSNPETRSRFKMQTGSTMSAAWLGWTNTRCS